MCAIKTNKMKRTITLLLLLLSLTCSHAMLFRSYQVEEGLSHSSVWAVMEDSRGYMWFGTNDGLNRFDGSKFKVFRRRNGDEKTIGNNFIHCIFEDRFGNFLVGTKEGLYSYNRQTETFTHISLDGKSRDDDKTSIHAIISDANGDIWVGCFGQGLYHLNRNLKVVRHYMKELPCQFITSLAHDMSGNIWIGTDRAGLFSLNMANGRCKSAAIPDSNIQTIYCDCRNTLWVGTSRRGLFHYRFRENVVNHISGASPVSANIYNVKSITPFGRYELVMGSEMGLVKVNTLTEQMTMFNDGLSYDNLQDNSIFSIAKDHEGGLWLGTYFSGVSYWSPYVNKFSYFTGQSGISGDISFVQGFAEVPDGRVFMATRNSGLKVYNPATRTVSACGVNLKTNNVQTLLSDGQNLLVSNYDSGVAVVDSRSMAVTKWLTTADGLCDNIVTSMLKSTDGSVYLGTNQGVNILKDGRLYSLKKMAGYPVKDIAEDYNGSIWFACHKYGLICLSIDGKYKSYLHDNNDAKSLMVNNVNCVLQDSKGNVWAGTEGGGLGILNPQSGKFNKIFTEGTGFVSDIIYSIVEDRMGNIWVTTGKGMVRITPGKYQVHKFNYIEKPLHLHYTAGGALLSHNGMMYIGGSTGFVSFNPQNIRENNIRPRVFITSFYIDGIEMHPGMDDSPLECGISDAKEIELESDQSSFSFDVSCMSFLAPSQNRILYKLEGFDEHWNEITGDDGHISYMNILSGDYTLYVKGMNNDGVEGKVVKLSITINRPFLLSNFMLLLYVMIISWLVWYIVCNYRNHLKSENKEKMYRFSMDKEKELYDSKIGFFTNIAHEIRTPLSLITAPLNTIIASGDGSEKTKKNLSIIQNNVKRLLELINQLLDFRKVEAHKVQLNFKSCNVSEKVDTICSRYKEFANMHKLSLNVEKPEEAVFCNLDEEAFDKMLGNLLSNAIKFANKEIKVTLWSEPSKLNVSVTDDGPGIKKDDQNKIFESFYQIDDHGKHPGTGLGLPLAKNLAMMHQGDVTVESEYGHGTTFLLTIGMNLEGAPSEETVEAVQFTEDPSAIDEVNNDSRPTVLIVEDNDELRSYIIDNMDDSYHMLEAENGIKALEVLEKEDIDIIVSDVMMPEMDGLELCRAVRSNSAYSHLPFIILSAKTDVSTKIDLLNIGANAYMEKPFSLEQLRAQIASILENRDRIRENFILSPLEYYKKTQHHEDETEKENAEFVEKLNQIILDNLSNSDFNIDELAKRFYMSRSNFHKKVKRVTGKTPNDYIKIIRLNKSAELLATEKYQVVEVCYMVGFNTPSYFSKCFQDYFHILPNEYIKNN